MDIQEQHQTSVQQWVLEQENAISILELNVDYLTKEIELKQLALDLNKQSLEHEKQFLSNYLKQQ